MLVANTHRKQREMGAAARVVALPGPPNGLSLGPDGERGRRGGGSGVRAHSAQAGRTQHLGSALQGMVRRPGQEHRVFVIVGLGGGEDGGVGGAAGAGSAADLTRPVARRPALGGGPLGRHAP